jgi:methyltransferase
MATAPPLAGLVAFLAYTIVERFAELYVSSRTRVVLLARGARESGAGHFWMFVVLHTLYPIALVAEVLGGHARPPAAWPVAFAVWLAAQALRVWAMRSLKERWNVRILVVPGEPLVRTGPYAWLPHPNYVAVVLDLASGPLMFGAWRTALGASLLNAIALAVRVPTENRALRETARG